MSPPFCAFARSVLDATADAVLVLEEDGRVVLSNPAADALFRAEPGALLERPVEVLLPDGLPESWTSPEGPGSVGSTAYTTVAALRLDGTEVAVDVSVSSVLDGSRPLRIAYARDVSWREQLFSDYRESERRNRMVLEGASEVFYRVALSDGGARVEFVSPQCERLTGHGPEDFISDPGQWTELLHPEDAPRVAERTDAILSGGSEGTRYYRIRNRDGRYRHVEDRIVPLTDDDGVLVGYQGVARDVSERVREVDERRELDLRLRQAERMEALGRMAGGVAHDFNNILTVILACCETALSEMEPDGPATRDIEEVAKAGRRAANLTRQLLGFSRKQVTAPRVVDLSSHLATLESLLRRTVTERVNLEFSLGRDLWRAYVDPAQIDQIVINLVANARDALGGSGSISIGTDSVVLDADFCAAHRGSTPGDYVMLSVHDDGSGMDEAALKNAFLPFFTTKPEGRGTGIGLSSVYGIVKQNGGYVRLDSEVGWGTTVEVYLPRYQGDVREKIATPRSPVSTAGHETVLLVEDDAEVRRATRKLLERLGFDVLEAETPFLAIEVCESHADQIDLLLTDVVMPGMNGAELAATIRALKPGIGTLFMSGYAERLAGDIGIPRDGFHYLEKPFDQEALAEAMQKALAKR